MDAFDADVLIYAAEPNHPLGRNVLALFPDRPLREEHVGVGSVLLLPELLVWPQRRDEEREARVLAALLSRLDLRAVDRATADLAVALGAAYGLRAIDASHLATAVSAGADRFITNNQRDFARSIEEIEIVYPDDLPAV